MKRLLKESEVAVVLGVKPKTLQSWRSSGGGPRYRKLGRSVRYHPGDVQSWLATQPSGGGRLDKAAQTVLDHKPWERVDGEPSKGYSAFCVFRDIGPSRSLSEAYRRSKADPVRQWEEKAEALAADPSPAVKLKGPSNNWKGWRNDWRWDERATAYDDAHNATTEWRARSEEMEAWERRRKQREAFDAMVFHLIAKLNKTIGEVLDRPELCRVWRKTRRNDSSQIVEIDSLKELEALCRVLAELGDRYFRDMPHPGSRACHKPEQSAVGQNLAELRWIPDLKLIEAAKLLIEGTTHQKRRPKKIR